jgi:GAF domain-containing protein
MTTTVSAERLARVFVEVADTLIDEFDLIDFLQQLATQTASLLDASSVGLVLADQKGRLEFMAASDESAKSLELFQVQSQEGPCHDAFLSGVPVVDVDLAHASGRWPRFAPAAVRAGFLSAHAFPMRLRAEKIGALNVFSSRVGGRLGESDIQIVQALADVASIGLLQERAISRGEQLTEQLQGALNSRITIEQAKGVLAQQTGISVDEAFALIRAHSRSSNLRLGEVAKAIIAGQLTLPVSTS